MRLRRQSGSAGRPLNFTVRSHLGTSGFAKKIGRPASIGSAVTSAAAAGLDRPAGVYVQRNRVRVRLAAASIEVGARALIGFVKQQSRLVRCAPGAEWFRDSLWGALNWETMSPWLAAVGATRAQW